MLSLHFSGGRESNKNMSEVIGTDRSDERRKKAKKKIQVPEGWVGMGAGHNFKYSNRGRSQ